MENVGGESGCVELISFEHDLRSFPSALDVLSYVQLAARLPSQRESINNLRTPALSTRKQRPFLAFVLCWHMQRVQRQRERDREHEFALEGCEGCVYLFFAHYYCSTEKDLHIFILSIWPLPPNI